MQQSFAEKLWHTISWTLLHSLWQGLLLTIIVAIILLATKRSAPAFRYSLLTALLFCFTATVAISFAWQWQQAAGAATAFTYTGTQHIVPAPHHWWNSVTGFMDRYSGVMIAVWAAVVGIKLLRMLLDLYYVKRLRSVGISEPGKSWTLHVQQLSHSMGIRKSIRLFESRLVKTPLVAGHFKPVILLPLGMLTQLSMAEVEAVLLHELAHIRRHDYMVNLLQRVTATLFFFNPGILWLSSLIRAERENCCDDMAIHQTKDKLTFIEALLSVKQHTLLPAPLAMNFLGQKNLLLQRVNRIVHSRNKSLNRAELGFVTLSMIAAALYFINATVTMPVPVTQPVAAESLLAATASSSPVNDEWKKAALTTSISSGAQKTVMPAGKERPVVKKLRKEKQSVSKQQVPEPNLTSAAMENEKFIAANNEFSQYPSAAEQDMLQAEQDRRRAALDRQQAERDRAQAALDRKQADLDRLQAEKDRAQADKDRAQAEKDRIQAEKDRAMYHAAMAA